jgi:hypothetical protein
VDKSLADRHLQHFNDRQGGYLLGHVAAADMGYDDRDHKGENEIYEHELQYLACHMILFRISFNTAIITGHY